MCDKLNTCPVCNYDATLMTWRHNHHDVFRCSSRYCGVLFEETGYGHELLPAEFETGEIYSMMVWSDENGDTPIEIEVVSRDEHRVECIVNDIAAHTFVIRKESGVEYVTLEEFGIEDCMYAYTKE